MSDSETNRSDITRRDAVTVGAVTAVGAAVALHFGKLRPAFAAGTDEIRVGVIGCGGRGTQAAVDALKAGKGVRLVAAADAFPDRLEDSLKRIEKDEDISKDVVDVPKERRFSGLDGYKKLLEIPEINYVVIASPPGFKAAQIQATIEAGKHLFTEKPMAVDGPTIRACFEAAKLADQKKLGVGVGLQRRHQKSYLESMKRIHGGQIGEITSGRVFWNMGSLWTKPRQAGWSDLEWQMRNWLYFTWLSGDHIVEQHIHNIDIAQWAIGKPAVAAVAVGGRQQRTDAAYGHIFDHFAVDYEYPNEAHVLSMCRQIPGCANDVSEHVQGTKGRSDMAGKAGHMITKGKSIWRYEKNEDTSPYVQEHIDLIAAIRKGKPYNELKAATESNLTAIMGRMAAYSGKRVTWEMALSSKESLVPTALAFEGKMKTPAVAIPGASDVI